jgi:SAM-dependent methyltransferase
MPLETFAGHTCSAPLERTRRMAAIVSAVLPRDARDVLDLGCGTGRLTQLLADEHPRLRLVGLDISSANIAAATANNRHATVRFEQADYLAYRGGPFDAIVTDGVLHLIPGDTRALLQRIAGDLRPGGVVVCAMPYACAYNTAFAVLRRLLRSIRSAWLDAAILAVARRLHGGTMSDDDLRERLPYMYLPPTRVMNADLRDRAARAAGLRLDGVHPMPSTSRSQLRHNVTVFRKDS